MADKYKGYHLEDFIWDDYFFSLAKKVSKNECIEEWNRLLEENPDEVKKIEEAYLIINGIHIREKEVSDLVILEKWNGLRNIMVSHKRRTLVYKWSGIVAAACLLIFFLNTIYRNEIQIRPKENKTDLLSVLDDMKSESSEIQMIVGEEDVIDINNDALIRQEEDGSIIVNEGKIQRETKAETEQIQLIVPNGKRTSLTLNDGSKIWVNSGTKLIYPSHFSENIREIFVDGEIYLDVARNESQPFIVHSKGLDVKVLGTSFNITTYKEDNFTNVVLVSGSVEVIMDNKVSTRLNPSDCFHLENGVKSVNQVDVYNYICWKEGILKLEKTTLDEIFNRLSRHYNIQILYGNHYTNIEYNGKLSMEESIDEVLGNIAMTEPFTYTKENNVIKIE